MTSPASRPRRATAGKTTKFSDFSVVSFPHLKKHSIVKTSLINIDPLSPLGTQAGNLKAFGERKKLVVIKTGTRLEMEEISTRFSKESGSEEIVIPERECEDPDIRDVDEASTIDDRYDDIDLFTPSTQRTKRTDPATTTHEQLTEERAKDKPPQRGGTAFDDDDEEEEDDDFHRILGKQSRSSTKKSTMKRKERTGSSSLSDSNDSEVEGEQQDQESRWSKNKENLMRDNVDLASLRKRKPSKKKQRTASLPVQQSTVDEKAVAAEISLLKKRVSKLEKVYSVIKKNTSFDQTKPSSSCSQSDITESLSTKVKAVFGVDPATLKSPINRPTKIMRELYKNSGLELCKWRDILEPNESLLKDFIQQKCLVLEEDIQHTWTSILNSMTQMPYDAVKYKSKSKPIGNASMPVSKEGDPPSVPQIAEIASQLDLND